MECAQIKILGARAANQLRRVGPEQSKLVIKQLRNAAAASKAGNPDALCDVQGLGSLRHRTGRDPCKTCCFSLELVGDQCDLRVETLAPPPGSTCERRRLRRPAGPRHGGAR